MPDSHVMLYLDGSALGQMFTMCSYYAIRDKGTLHAESTRRYYLMVPVGWEPRPSWTGSSSSESLSLTLTDKPVMSGVLYEGSAWGGPASKLTWVFAGFNLLLVWAIFGHLGFFNMAAFFIKTSKRETLLKR